MRLAKVKHKHDAELIAALLRKVDDPDPTIDMGETGEEYSFEVFRFAAKCLITGSTCSEIARLVDVFFDCFYPKRAGAIRLPGRRQWEEWRCALLLHGRVRVLKLMQKMDLFHIAGDATTKGKSKKSRKTGILQTAGRGVKDGEKFDVIFNFDVIKDGTAETEMQSMLEALEINFSGVTEKVSILKAISGTTDHATVAQQSMELLQGAKEREWNMLSDVEKQVMSDHEKKLATTFKIRNCQSHFANVLTSNYCGGRYLPDRQGQHPDKALVTHGKVEFYVQSRLCAASILIRHLEIAAGRLLCARVRIDAPFLTGNTWSVEGAEAKARRVMHRWVFQKMSSHWNQCIHNKNPAPWTSSSIPSISGLKSI